eukprot:TRINITY_DN11016_c0_g1_i1.p1 TRINITY_DN11016_c0_g1~~TRINITY_DN11016_c0_g1_i1.p1  ORF type:complete len:209 (+),score=45.20 TRINITY_DN11016_c0_g1_i1:55-681(+)
MSGRVLTPFRKDIHRHLLKRTLAVHESTWREYAPLLSRAAPVGCVCELRQCHVDFVFNPEGDWVPKVAEEHARQIFNYPLALPARALRMPSTLLSGIGKLEEGNSFGQCKVVGRTDGEVLFSTPSWRGEMLTYAAVAPTLNGRKQVVGARLMLGFAVPSSDRHVSVGSALLQHHRLAFSAWRVVRKMGMPGSELAGKGTHWNTTFHFA